MSGALALAIGLLFAIGTYLLLQRALTRIVIGLGLIGHGTNLLLLAVSGPAGAPPIINADGSVPVGVADPVPQALALTAIVIAFGVTAFLLAMGWRSFALDGHDQVEDDVEDRRIARLAVEGDIATGDVVSDEGVR
jgi:multicomponent Na+:H+ antiporter subunit C